MPDVNVLAVLVAAVAAFALSTIWYAAFGARLAEASTAASVGEQPPPWKVAVELLRGLVLATVLAGLASQGDIATSGPAACCSGSRCGSGSRPCCGPAR